MEPVFWSGRLKQLDPWIPLKRGQIIPYTMSAGEPLFFSGIALGYDEFAGFGGKIDPGETAEEAAHRELYEESAGTVYIKEENPRALIYKHTLCIIAKTPKLNPRKVVEKYDHIFRKGTTAPNGELIDVWIEGRKLTLENSEIIASNADDMDMMADGYPSASGLGVWPFYSELLWHVRDTFGPFHHFD